VRGLSPVGPEADVTFVTQDDFDRLAARQREVMAALVAGGPVPAGFDGARLEETGASLARKRFGVMRRAWPRTVESLGEGARTLFEEFARSHPLRDDPPDGPEEPDGLAFTGWLAVRGQLPDAGCRERARCRLHRGERVVLERTSAGWLVGVRCPGLGIRHVTLPWRWTLDSSRPKR